MTTPNDAARPGLFRPVVQKHGATKTGYIAVMTDKPNPADDWKDESLRWVTAADYDALRAELERMTALRDGWGEKAKEALSVVTSTNDTNEKLVDKVAKLTAFAKHVRETAFDFINEGIRPWEHHMRDLAWRADAALNEGGE